MLSLLSVISGRPWAIRADIAAAVYRAVMRDGFGALRSVAELKAAIHAYDNERAAARRGDRGAGSGAVGVIQIMGMLTKNGDVVGSTPTLSTDEVGAAAEEMSADQKVDSIVLRIDSPGGEVRGVTEAFSKIRAASKVKPVVAAVDGDMASAALWLGAGATEIMVTPSGGAGSLGVYALHTDESDAMKADGVKITPIAADDSPFKVEGAPWEPLGDEAFAQMKKEVNRFMGDFVRDVARGRGVSVEHVRQHFGRGRMLSPQEAVSVGMANSIGTLDAAIRRAAQLGKERRESVAGARAFIALPASVTEEIDPPVTAQAPPATEPRPAGPTAEQLAAVARLRTL